MLIVLDLFLAFFWWKLSLARHTIKLLLVVYFTDGNMRNFWHWMDRYVVDWHEWCTVCRLLVQVEFCFAVCWHFSSNTHIGLMAGTWTNCWIGTEGARWYGPNLQEFPRNFSLELQILIILGVGNMFSFWESSDSWLWTITYIFYSEYVLLCICLITINWWREIVTGNFLVLLSVWREFLLWLSFCSLPFIMSLKNFIQVRTRSIELRISV